MFVKKVLITIILVLFDKQIFACTCNNFQTIEENYQQAGYVVLAKLVRDEETSHHDQHKTYYIFKVIEQFKGHPLKKLNYKQSNTSTSCDPEVNEGDYWLLFINDPNKEVFFWLM